MVTRFTVRKIAAMLAGSVLLVGGMVIGAGQVATADVPDPIVATEFQADQCAGETDDDPTANNPLFAVPDTTLVFGARLDSYNGGHIVPLYDSYGSTILILADGSLNADAAAYPPVCGTRYVEAEGAAVSEWMFCTDRFAHSCGDTNLEGNLVDGLGTPINPMVDLDGNPKLSADQEKLIAYLVQHGHPYAGVGDQAWGGATDARSDGTSSERQALQTLVWCVSDPATDVSDFGTTCENVLPAAEQSRLLAMIPDAPSIVLDLTGTEVELGTAARFTVTTNVYNQPIELVTGGTAAATWSVCEGDATLAGTTLTIAGTDPSVSTSVVLCAEVAGVGTVTLDAAATPPSTEHIGWSQSQDNPDSEPCQVYATFHVVDQVQVEAAASVTFVEVTKPGDGGADPKDQLAASGGDNVSGALIALLVSLLAVGGVLVARSRGAAHEA